ncbi:MAG: AAC(3) family N-acetyltransferase [Chloroflexota bacterium]|nr:AAC(3) family N-acetyltransferase [Chloroflexota bacterium]MDE2920754.1 AAC(3) family N-acetyltransferase [Chloroflexota bacterium]
MVLTQDRIAADLRRLGVQSGDVLMIHSSLRSMGHVIGGAPTVVDALLEVLGPAGTLVGPSFNYETALDPNFVLDLPNTPSDMGAIADEIRRRAGKNRSRHLTHSLSAIGHHAQTIVTAPGPTAWSADGPLGTVFKLNGRFLLLGVTYQSFTACHLLEVAFRLRYRKLDTLSRSLCRTDGSLIPFESIVFLRDVGYPGYDFNRLGQAMEDVGLTSVAPVGNAIARLIPARLLREFATPRVQRDPDYLLQQGSGVTPLTCGVTLTLPGGVLSVVDPGGVFRAPRT